MVMEMKSDDASLNEAVIDVWTFERDTQIADPNWKLVETSSEGGGCLSVPKQHK